MPDLLAHALLAYSLCTALSWRYAWITPAYVTTGMAGAFIPNMMKVGLIVHSGVVERTLGVQFDWWGLHTFGGALVAVLIGMVVVVNGERRRVGGLLAVGAGSHLLADALLLTPSGYSYAVLWPLTRWHPPTPGLYLSTEPGPTGVAAVVAVGAWGVTRWRTNTGAGGRT